MGEKPIASRFGRYILTGGSAAVVDTGLFFGLTEVRTPTLLAAVLSFVVAAIVNYLLTSRYVFGASRGPGQFVAFFAAALVGLAVNATITVEAIHYAGIAAVPAKLLGIGTAFGLNFLLNSTLVFRRSA